MFAPAHRTFTNGNPTGRQQLSQIETRLLLLSPFHERFPIIHGVAGAVAAQDNVLQVCIHAPDSITAYSAEPSPMP